MTEQGLIYRSGGRLHALALDHIIEIMRPLPIETSDAETPLVKGIAIIRGEPTTIFDLASLSSPSPTPPRRLVSLRVGTGRFAMLADEVIGVQALPDEQRLMLGELDEGAIAVVNTLAPDLRAILQQILVVVETPDEDDGHDD